LRTRHSSKSSPAAAGSARVFFALGDPNRLRLVSRLCDRGPLSITALSEGSKVTRQAVTKHLHVMEKAGIVRCSRRGRESLWQLDPRRIEEARRYLDGISGQWDSALDRLRAFVES